MDTFSEQEKEAVLDEIEKIRQVLGGGGENVERFNLVSSEESDFEEYNDDSSYVCEDEEDELDDSPSIQAKSSSVWQTYDKIEKDNDSGENDNAAIIIQKTKATLEKSFDSLQSSVTFDESFIKTSSCVIDAEATIPAASTAVSHLQKDSADAEKTGEDTSHIDIGSLELALQLNRDYQELVTDELIQIDCALKNNRSKQAEVESRSSGTKSGGMLGYSFFARFRPTYFKDQFGQGPPDNEDSKARDALKAVHPFFKPQKVWKEKDRQLLAEGVRNQNLERMSLDLQQRLNDLKNKPKNKSSDIDDSSLHVEIKEVQKQISNLKKIPPQELEMSLEGLDFHNISRLYLPERQEKECRIRWLNLEHPSINHSKWTKAEDTKLLALSRKYNRRHWEKVAQELGTKRTPVQCCQRFQRSLNKDLLKSGWTEEEDQQLTDAVKACTKGNWLQVSNMLEGRTPMQCLNRYEKCLKPGLKKGPWSKEENELLLKYVEIYGPGKWSRISEHIPGRSDTSVRERWVNFYDPSLKLHRKWSKKEDILLLESVEKHGVGKWSKISKDIPGRSDNMCWRRWKLIQKQESARYYEKIQNKREVLNYFVNRKDDVPNVDFEMLKSNESNEAVTATPTASTSTVTTTASARSNESNSNPYRLRSRLKAPFTDEALERDAESGDSAADKIEIYEEGQSDKTDSEIGVDNSKNRNTKVIPDISTKLGPEQEKMLNRDNLMDDTEIIDLGNQTLIDDGERIVGRYKAGIVSYIDTKKGLYLLKSRYEDVSNKRDREKLILVHARHVKELENIHNDRKERENMPVVKRKRDRWRRLIDINETVHGPENIGARSMRAIDLGHMPAELAPFTILLEVFRINYASIIESLQANKSITTEASTSKTTSPTTSTASSRQSLTSSCSKEHQPPMTAPAVKTREETKTTLKAANQHERLPPIIPIAPNIVTMKAFGRLLLHSKRLREICNMSKSDQSSQNSEEKISAIAQENNSKNAKPVGAAVPVDRTKATSFPFTRDYRLLSARFNALFQWPLLLFTHEARKVDASRSMKTGTNLAASSSRTQEYLQQKKPGNDGIRAHYTTESLHSKVAPATNTSNQRSSGVQLSTSTTSTVINSNGELSTNFQESQKKKDSDERRRSDNIVHIHSPAKKSRNTTASVANKSRMKRKISKKEKQCGKKRRKILSSDESENDEIFPDSDFSDPDFEIINETHLGLKSESQSPVSIGKESLRRSKRSIR